MHALMSLEPREAGTEVLDPVVDFGDIEDDLHKLNGCIETLCLNHTEVCVSSFPPV
jgi:hypothetical protein